MPFDDADMIRLAPRFAPLCRAGNRLLLHTEESVLCEEDPLTADILEALFVARTVSGLETFFDGRRTSAEFRNTLEQLSARGLLQIGPEPPSAQSAYWDSVGCPAPAPATIDFQPLCPAGRNDIQFSLQANGIALSSGSGFRLVTTDDYLRPELAEISLRQQPWLLAKPVGHTIWIGPLFLPNRAPCWSCMALWIRPHRWQQIAVYGLGESELPPQPSFAATPASLGIAAQLIAAAVALAIAQGGHPELEAAILSFDTRSLRWHRSVVRKHPECQRCQGSSTQPLLVPLHSFLSPLTGILSAVQITDEPVCGFFHALGHFPAPLPRPGITRLLKPQHSVGKGLSSHEAETCCIAEGLERYSVLFRGDERRVRARADQLNALPVDQLLLFSEAQYRDRLHWNSTHSEMHWVPERFDPNIEVDWTEVRSLVTGQIAFVPTAVCFMHYDFRGQPQFCAGDSNGCAAGPSFKSATLSALLELIERDAVAIWWYNQLHLPKLDLAAFGDPLILQLEEAFAATGRSLYVLDITTDLQVPACVAIAPKMDGSEPCFGTAAELSYRRAAFKAISEAAQVCFWTDTGNGSDELLSWVCSTAVQQHPYLCAHGTKVATCGSAIAPSVALQQTVNSLYELGLETFCLDITRPEIGLPVARVFVPELRHFWGRLGQGRLYDVPVRQGLQANANAEGDLNPVPCMI